MQSVFMCLYMSDFLVLFSVFTLQKQRDFCLLTSLFLQSKLRLQFCCLQTFFEPQNSHIHVISEFWYILKHLRVLSFYHSFNSSFDLVLIHQQQFTDPSFFFFFIPFNQLPDFLHHDQFAELNSYTELRRSKTKKDWVGGWPGHKTFLPRKTFSLLLIL